jgi:glycosyltransferase involved in cell wall biosynthesis
MNPFVTVCIPTHKRLAYLKESVQSALDQTYDRLEILIGQDVDPQSGQLNEEIASWCESMVAKHSHLRYQYNQTNLKLAGNWNALGGGARGEYLVMIGDDDRLLPNFVEKLVGALEPGVQVVFSNQFLIDSTGRRLMDDTYLHTKNYWRDRIPAGILDCAEKWVWRNAIPISSAIIMTSAVQKFGFKPELNCPEIELFVRIAQSGGSFAFVPEYLAEYRYHSDQETAFGLNVERLVVYLIDLPVSPEMEQYKREFISSLIAHSAGRCLEQGLVCDARKLIDSPYYPRARWIDYLVQKSCSCFPSKLAAITYKSFLALKERIKGLK